MKTQRIISFFLLLSLVACHDSKDNVSCNSVIMNPLCMLSVNSKALAPKKIVSDTTTFPNVKNLLNYKKTLFVPTLESELPDNKNAVYAASLLFAWDKVKSIVNCPLIIEDTANHELILLNSSTSHKAALKKDECNTTASVSGINIIVKAKFSKTLEYVKPLDYSDINIKFDNKYVSSFGIYRKIMSASETVDILYYKDDNHFVIRLKPKNQEHEIILAIGIKLKGRFIDLLKQVEHWIGRGKKEKMETQKAWKYVIKQGDKLSIPALKFNIETRFENLENNRFGCSAKEFYTKEVYQRTAFILDRNGAKVESEAREVCAGLDDPNDDPKAKLLVFDKPFIVYLKRKDSKYPYFALLVRNNELMIK